MTSQMERSRAILKSGSILARVPDDVLGECLKRARMTRFAKGEAIYRRGEPGDSFMIVLSGRIKISNISGDAREVILNFLGEGDLNGELAALDGKGRSADATALEPTEVAILYRRDILPILERQPQALLSVIAVLCEKLRMTSAMVEHGLLQMSGKAAGGLLRLASLHGRETDEGTVIDFKLSQRDLGGYFGLSRENTSRELGRLRDEGLIRIDGSRIVIVDAEALRDLAGEEAE